MNAYTLKPGDLVCGQYYDVYYSGVVSEARRHTMNRNIMVIFVTLDSPIQVYGYTQGFICICCNQYGLDGTDSSIEHPIDPAIPFWTRFFAATVCYFAFADAGISWL